MIMQSGIRLTLFVLVLISLAACGTKSTSLVAPELALEQGSFQTERNHWPAPGDHDIDVLDVYDPWEPMNRNIYAFNAGFDEYVFLPVVSGYQTVVPDPVQKGVHNVFANVNDLSILFNCLLQGRLKKGAITTSRFLINTTFGVGGLMDVASEAPHLQKQNEDFGQTLGTWGIGDGPYFVMPFLGPSNLRDTVGFGGDFLLLLLEMKQIYKVLGIKNTIEVAIADLIVRSIDRRANTPFRYHSTGSPFEYELIRFIYTEKRKLDIRR